MDKKEVKVVFKEIIEDILDHYDEYSDDERNEIKAKLKDLYILNQSLAKYDKVNKFKESLHRFLGFQE